MTERSFTFFQRLSLTVNHGFSSMRASVYASSGGYFGYLIRNMRTGELMLPVKPGAGFAIIAENSAAWMGAFPARLGTANGHWRNLFAACEENDLAHMPSTGGMMEVMPHDRFAFDGMLLPHGQKAPFIISDEGANYEGEAYDRIEIGYRFPTDPNAIPGMPAGAVSRGVSIVTGPVVEEERIITNLGYEEVASSFGVITLVARDELARALEGDGLNGLDPDNDRHWSAGYLQDNNIPVVANMMVDAAS